MSTTESTASAARDWLEANDGEVEAAAKRQAQLVNTYRIDGLNREEKAELDALNHLDDCINRSTGFTLEVFAREVANFVTPEHMWGLRCLQLVKERMRFHEPQEISLLSFFDLDAWSHVLRASRYEFEVGGMTFISD